MKKNLLATSALVAAGVLATSGAFAESKPIELQVGGYMEQWVGFSSYDGAGLPTDPGNVNDVDVQQDAEIHFTGRTTLDNGLTFGVNVQLEAQSSGDQIDEAYAFVRGSFGEILIGSENGAAYAMHYGFGDFRAGATLNTGDLSSWFFAPQAYELSGTYGGFRHNDNDSEKVRYISPRFSGFQIGADYAPEGDDDSDTFPTEVNNAGTPEQIWSVSANYQGDFDGIGLGVSGAYQGIGDGNGATGDDPYNYGFGVYVTFSGFRLSGSWTHENDPRPTIDNRDVFGAGISYGDGPWVVKLDGAYGTQSYGAAGAPDTDQLSLELGAGYKLGPGVEARGSVFYADQSDGNGVSGADASGFAVVGGIRLVF
jgi:predicted porin